MEYDNDDADSTAQTIGYSSALASSWNVERTVTSILPEAAGEEWASHPEAASYLTNLTSYTREDICRLTI